MGSISKWIEALKQQLELESREALEIPIARYKGRVLFKGKGRKMGVRYQIGRSPYR